MESKTCKKCGETKSLEEFKKHKQCKDGYEGTCLVCVSVRDKEYRAKHAPKLKAYREDNKARLNQAKREWYQVNREHALEYARQYRDSNLEQTREATRKWWEQNPEKVVAYQKQYLIDNKVRLNRQSREYADTHKEEMKAYRQENRELVALWAHQRRIKMHNQEFDPEVTKEKLRERDGDYCCFCGVGMFFGYVSKAEYNPALATLEHITAVTRGGGHTFDNTALSCKQCNSSKLNKTLLWEWVAYVP